MAAVVVSKHVHKLQAVIFDLDGLMVDSEPLARQKEAAWNEIWPKGVPNGQTTAADFSSAHAIFNSLEEVQRVIRDRQPPVREDDFT